ncbi:MAG: SPASM domain-containing protein [Chitinivibrionales bacterium]|nr:SPASM domain-containing protein [Chitinivibrionales bacterium]
MIRKERIQRAAHYLRLFQRHATMSRIFNLLKIETRLRCNNSDVSGLYPYCLTVDLSNTCNLSCPLCQTGLRQSVVRRSLMNLATFTRIVDSLKKYLFQVFLYNWSEPFLNRDVYDIISYLAGNNMASVVSTNANIPIDARRLVESGLEYLVISADGCDQESYRIYRRGGDIATVFENIDAIVAHKRRTRTVLPFIEWQCLVHRHNEHLMDSIRSTAYGHGVDTVRFASLNYFSVGDSADIKSQWLPNNRRYRPIEKPKREKSGHRLHRKPCPWLWRSAFVTADGGLIPCCLYDVENWGNLLHETLPQAWSNELFCQARNRSAQKKEQNTIPLICDRCTAPFIFR